MNSLAWLQDTVPHSLGSVPKRFIIARCNGKLNSEPYLAHHVILFPIDQTIASVSSFGRTTSTQGGEYRQVKSIQESNGDFVSAVKLAFTLRGQRKCGKIHELLWVEDSL